jgi:uncharacterized membrane protein
MGRAKPVDTEQRVFNALITALMLLVGTVVVGAVAYGIYVRPPGPDEAGTATVEVAGDGRFRGEVGIDSSMRAVEGTAPFSMEVPHGRADYVSVNI